MTSVFPAVVVIDEEAKLATEEPDPVPDCTNEKAIFKLPSALYVESARSDAVGRQAGLDVHREAGGSLGGDEHRVIRRELNVDKELAAGRQDGVLAKHCYAHSRDSTA